MTSTGKATNIASAETLVGSSAATRSWLHKLRDDLPGLQYSEAKHWASFKTEPGGRRVADLNPTKKHLRLFLALDPGDEPDLQPTPSSGGWAKQYRSVFEVSGIADLAKAKRLILKSDGAIRQSTIRTFAPRPAYLPVEELGPEAKYAEGSASQIVVNAYERNRRARAACLRHYGASCAACGFIFETKYGEAAAGYIQVHHVTPIAQAGQEYRLDPIRDLRPVCANCHAVIYRREPPFSIEELRQMVRNKVANLVTPPVTK